MNHIKLTLIFDAGKEVDLKDQNILMDGIINLLETKFPDHSGSCMTCCLVNENGDLVKS